MTKRQQTAAAFAVYVIASLVLFGRPVLGDPTHTCLCIGGTTDEGVIAWAFEWWPHALLHGLDPFHSPLIYAPQGFDIAQGGLMPGLSLVFAPVTALGGPSSPTTSRRCSGHPSRRCSPSSSAAGWRARSGPRCSAAGSSGSRPTCSVRRRGI